MSQDVYRHISLGAMLCTALLFLQQCGANVSSDSGPSDESDDNSGGPVACVAPLDSVQAPYANAGTEDLGTEDNPIQISSYGQLLEFANKPEDWSKHVKLVSDIDACASAQGGDLVDPDETPGSGDEYLTGFPKIGSCGDDASCSKWGPSEDDTPFSGVFDGDGHSISNLVIRGHSGEGLGLFAFVGQTGVVRNVRLVDAKINQDLPASLEVTSSISGSLVGSNYGTIQGSHASAQVSCDSNCGVLVGHLNVLGTVTDSSSSGSVTGRVGLGGLVADNRGTIRRSFSHANVTGNGNLGGLVGLSFSVPPAIITDSYATGTVTATGTGEGYSQIGGFAARVDRSVIRRSYSSGSVIAPLHTHVGGFIGYMNYGLVSENFATGSVSGKTNVGGFIGFIENPMRGATVVTDDGTITGAEIQYSDSSGSVSADQPGANSIGGFAGRTRAVIQRCFSTSSVNSVGVNVGGFAGLVYGAGWWNLAEIYDSFATGAVTGGSGVGSFVGLGDQSTYVRNFGIGLVSLDEPELEGANQGGFLGDPYAGGNSFSANYWNTESTGQMTTHGTATGHTTAQMSESSNFAGWDFDNVWTMSAEYGIPTLRQESTTTWDMDTVWVQPDGELPYLRWQDE